LQYYDKEGVLPPSGQSEGGRRLYSGKDIVRLHQIQAMKYLGFSLNDIKTRLVALDTPTDVSNALAEQARSIREKIAVLSEILESVEKLKAETLQMETVDWGKYADIVANLQMKNEWYGLIKHFDEKVLHHYRSRFDREGGAKIVNAMKRICGEAAGLQQAGIPPDSEQGQAIGKAWWDMVTEFTGGDASLQSHLMELYESRDGLSGSWKKQWERVEGFITAALEMYLTNLGCDPSKGEPP